MAAHSPSKDFTDLYSVLLVRATIFNGISEQTDSTPLITASGFYLKDSTNAYRYRIIAVSRDLYDSGLKFGTRILITGTKKYNGVWTVHDLMNKRYKSRIDLLVNKGMKAPREDEFKIFVLK